MSLKRTLPHHGSVVIGYSYVLPSTQILLEATILCANSCTQWLYCIERRKKIDVKKKERIFTTAIACIKGDIIDSYATTCSIRSPCTLEHDIEVRIFIDISLSIAPCGTLIVIQLPYRFSFRRHITDLLDIHSQDTYKITKCLLFLFVFVQELHSLKVKEISTHPN